MLRSLTGCRPERGVSSPWYYRYGVIFLLLWIAGPATAWSAAQPFIVHHAKTSLYSGVWLVSAQIDFNLSEAALEALDSGVDLTISLQFRIDRVRRFWPDKKTATLEQRFVLSYQPLTDRYVVRNLNSGEQSSYATLYSALGDLGRVVDLPIIDAALLDSNDRYIVSMRAVLDQNTLPGPLRLIAFWSSGFRLESDWYIWKLSA